MNQSKNLFFSEDEIEAVDMEIETMLLARKRQESLQQSPEPIETPRPSQPISRTPVASRPSLEAALPVIVDTAIDVPSSILPPQRWTELTAETQHEKSESQSILIHPDGDYLPWPEAEPYAVQQQKSARGLYRSHWKWMAVFAVVLIMWTAMISAGYAMWQNDNFLALSRFVFNLF